MTTRRMLKNFFYKSNAPSIEDNIKDCFLFGNHRDTSSRNSARDTVPDTFVFKHPALENTSGLSYFDKLPDDVLLNIFGRLPKNKLENMALVCCRFNRIINDPTLWKTVTLNWTRRIITPNCLRNVTERKIRRLILREAEIPCAIANDPSFQLLHLTHLDLTQAVFLQKTLTALFEKCKNLIKLSVTEVGDEALLALADGANEDLAYLRLTFSYGTTGEGIEALLTNCKRLKQFEFERTEVTPETLSMICRNLPPSLEHLSILGIRNKIRTTHLSDIFANCPELIGFNVDSREVLWLVQRVTGLKPGLAWYRHPFGQHTSFKLYKDRT